MADRTPNNDIDRHATDTAEEFGRLLDSGRPSEIPAVSALRQVVIGTLLGFLEPHLPLVAYAGQPGTAAIPAKLAGDVDERHIGHEVVLQFEDGDPHKPIVLARVRKPQEWAFGEHSTRLQVHADGRRVLIDAKEEITLRCGGASITLTKAGKVLVKGTYVLSQSAGVNRIKGGSVQVN